MKTQGFVSDLITDPSRLIGRTQFPVMYRGAEIHPSAGYCGGYDWVHHDYMDASYDDGGWSTFGCGWDSGINACKDSIDSMFEHLESLEE